MFSWLRKNSTPPPRAAENPGRGHEFTMAFSNGEKSWSESGNLLSTLAAELELQGHHTKIRSRWLEHSSGLLLVPHIVAVNPREDTSVHTVSTIQFSHPRWLPQGCFEYQHATGATVRESLADGFKNWMALDLPVLLDAGHEAPSQCTHIRMTPGREGTSLLRSNRRVIFGPTQHMAQRTDPGGTEEHSFCPCCLFTRNADSFSEHVRREDFFAIRFFAWRSADGQTIEADCRVNGVDFPEAVPSILRYVNEWPQRGMEYRKQYVAIQSV